jgi:hypothetical protein
MHGDHVHQGLLHQLVLRFDAHVRRFDGGEEVDTMSEDEPYSDTNFALTVPVSEVASNRVLTPPTSLL